MSRLRTALVPAAVLPVALIAATLGVLTGSGPSSAQVAAPPAVARPLPGARIQGVITNDRGRAMDDVDVVAINEAGIVVAAAYTYSSTSRSGPQHGYYNLVVKRGVYTVVAEADGYQRATVRDVVVPRRTVITLPTIELEKLQAPSKLRAEADDSSITTRERAQIEVRVTTPFTRKPLGTLLVKEGRETVAVVRLRSSNRGEVEIDLGTLDRGVHQFRVTYSGTPDIKPASAPAVEFSVRKARRR